MNETSTESKLVKARWDNLIFLSRDGYSVVTQSDASRYNLYLISPSGLNRWHDRNTARENNEAVLQQITAFGYVWDESLCTFTKNGERAAKFTDVFVLRSSVSMSANGPVLQNSVPPVVKPLSKSVAPTVLLPTRNANGQFDGKVTAMRNAKGQFLKLREVTYFKYTGTQLPNRRVLFSKPLNEFGSHCLGYDLTRQGYRSFRANRMSNIVKKLEYVDIP